MVEGLFEFAIEADASGFGVSAAAELTGDGGDIVALAAAERAADLALVDFAEEGGDLDGADAEELVDDAFGVLFAASELFIDAVGDGDVGEAAVLLDFHVVECPSEETEGGLGAAVVDLFGEAGEVGAGFDELGGEVETVGGGVGEAEAAGVGEDAGEEAVGEIGVDEGARAEAEIGEDGAGGGGADHDDAEVAGLFGGNVVVHDDPAGDLFEIGADAAEAVDGVEVEDDGEIVVGVAGGFADLFGAGEEGEVIWDGIVADPFVFDAEEFADVDEGEGGADAVSIGVEVGADEDAAGGPDFVEEPLSDGVEVLDGGQLGHGDQGTGLGS